MEDLALVEIFTDGACRGNPGPGGWAWDWEHFKYMILPAVTMSVIPMGIVTRTVRALVGDRDVADPVDDSCLERERSVSEAAHARQDPGRPIGAELRAPDLAELAGTARPRP